MNAMLYTDCRGSYIFSAEYQLQTHVPYKNPQESNRILARGEWTPEERDLLARYGPEFFVGVKREKNPGITITQDPVKLERIRTALRANLPEIRAINILITKADIKTSVGKDQLIIRCVNSIEDIGKTANQLCKRLREWYELYNPEFSAATPDHERFVHMLLERNRDELLSGIGMQPELTMGADLSEADVAAMIQLAQEAQRVFALKELETRYLEEQMQALCPNMTRITGALIGARLLSHAGSLQRMAELPSSTIQLLGAEKALFRHLTNKRSLPPKYGILHEHPFIARATRADHGKVARGLADKISIAVKVDFFKGEFIGDKLMADLEKRFSTPRPPKKKTPNTPVSRPPSTQHEAHP